MNATGRNLNSFNFTKCRVPVGAGQAQDVHSLLQDIMNSQNNAQESTGQDNYATPPNDTTSNAIGFVNNEVYFESATNWPGIGIGQFMWNIPPLNSNNPINNCVEILIGEFYLPKPAQVGAVDPLYYRRVFMRVAELDQISVRNDNGPLYHWEFAVEVIHSNAVLLRPLRPALHFRTSLPSLSTLSVSFLAPNPATGRLDALNIPATTAMIYMALTNNTTGYNPIRFFLVSPGNAGSAGVPLAPGLLAFVTNFASTDPNINALINSPDGILVTNVIDNRTIEIGNIDGSSLTSPFTATIAFAKNRLAFPLRFTSLATGLTNNIAVVQT